jgi:methionine--tRNA ligase beta chain
MDPTFQAYIARMLSFVGSDDPMEILSSTASRVAALVAAVPAAARSRKPAPERWSINEIVAHLADAEVVGGYRIRMILACNGIALQAFDQDRWAATFDYQSCDALESAQIFAAGRAGTLRLLRRVAPALLDNHGMHEERGEETVRHLIRLYAGHDRNHLAQIERLGAESGAPARRTPEPQKPEVPLDLLDRLDLRVGTITAIDEVTGADRLMRLQVAFGSETRTVIAGIKEERSDPRSLVGRQALFYYNLPRRRIRGHDSEAMLCDVGHADGLLPALLQPEWPVPDGTRAG